MIAILPSGKLIHLIVLKTPAALARGLQNVECMREDWGALFCFRQTKVQPFWTFGCRFPLDIVWLDESGMVLELVTVPPCHQQPCPTYGQHPARCVLELNAGIARHNGLVPGAKVALV